MRNADPGEGSLPAPRERVFKNTVATITARIASDGFHVLAALKQARYLGEKEWGIFGYLLSSMDVFRVLTSFGLDIVAIRIMAVGAQPSQTILRHLLLLKTILSVIAVAAVAVLSLFLGRFAEHLGLLLVLGLGLFPIGYLSSITVRFQVEHRMERLIPAQFASGALYLVGVHAIAWAGLGVPAFITLFVGYQLIALLLTAATFRWTWSPRLEGARAPGVDWSLARNIFRQGVPVGALMIMCVIYSRLGVFLLERFRNIEAVGHYFIAIKVSEPLLAIAGALSMSAYPVLSRLVEQGKALELRRRFLSYSGWSALLSCTIATLLTIFAPLLLRTIRPDYVAATGALVALSWATVFMFQNQLSTATLNSFGKFHYVTGFAALNLCTFLIFSLVLVRRMGLIGAGLSTLGTEGINLVAQFLTVVLMLRHMARRGQAAAYSSRPPDPTPPPAAGTRAPVPPSTDR